MNEFPFILAIPNWSKLHIWKLEQKLLGEVTPFLETSMPISILLNPHHGGLVTSCKQSFWGEQISFNIPKKWWLEESGRIILLFGKALIQYHFLEGAILVCGDACVCACITLAKHIAITMWLEKSLCCQQFWQKVATCWRVEHQNMIFSKSTLPNHVIYAFSNILRLLSSQICYRNISVLNSTVESVKGW